MRRINETLIPIVLKSWILPKVKMHLTNQSLKQDKKYVIYLEFEDYTNWDSFHSLIQSFESLKLNYEQFEFVVPIKDNKNILSQDELNNFRKFNEIINEKKSQLYFQELDVLWNINEIDNANSKLDSTVQEIKNANLSPLEQFLYAFNSVTSKTFYRENLDDSSCISRSIIGVLNTDKIVCVGYSAWLKEILNKLNNENINCHMQFLYNKQDKYDKFSFMQNSGHCNNIVYIKDEKYNVNGYYYVDACWDSVSPLQNSMSLAYSLIPINDILHTKDKFDYDVLNEFSYFYPSSEVVTKKQSQINKETWKFLKSQNFIDISKTREAFVDKFIGNCENKFINATAKARTIKNTCISLLSSEENYFISEEECTELHSLLNSVALKRFSISSLNKLFMPYRNCSKKIKNEQACINLKDTLLNWCNNFCEDKRKDINNLYSNLKLNSFGQFISEDIESKYLKSIMSNIKEQSSLISYNAMSQALETMLVKGKNISTEKAKAQTYLIMKNTAHRIASDFYLSSCQGLLAKESIQINSYEQRKHDEMRKRRTELVKKHKSIESDNQDITK